MKGKRPDDEIAGVSSAWRILEVRPLSVPGLNEERHLVVIQKADGAEIA
jgi:16S rRNA (guanine527-N7)-methyltransferase